MGGVPPFISCFAVQSGGSWGVPDEPTATGTAFTIMGPWMAGPRKWEFPPGDEGVDATAAHVVSAASTHHILFQEFAMKTFTIRLRKTINSTTGFERVWLETEASIMGVTTWVPLETSAFVPKGADKPQAMVRIAGLSLKELAKDMTAEVVSPKREDTESASAPAAAASTI